MKEYLENDCTKDIDNYCTNTEETEKLLKNCRTGVWHVKDIYNQDYVSLGKNNKEEEKAVINKIFTASTVDMPTIESVNFQNFLNQETYSPTLAPSPKTNMAPRMVTLFSKILRQKCMDAWIPTMYTFPAIKLSINYLTPIASRTSNLKTSGLMSISMRRDIHWHERKLWIYQCMFQQYG